MRSHDKVLMETNGTIGIRRKRFRDMKQKESREAYRETARKVTSDPESGGPVVITYLAPPEPLVRANRQTKS